MPTLYISSNKYSLRERKNRHGKTVYDVVFRVTTEDGRTIQKNLCGYTTKALAKQAYLEFTTRECTLAKNIRKKIDVAREIPTVDELHRQYIASLGNHNKDATIYGKKSHYERFIRPYYGDKKVTVLTKQELYLWQDKVWSMKNPSTGDFYAWEYLSNIRNTFRSLLAWCEERYDIKNYFDEVAIPKKRTPKTEMLIWTQDEFRQFISVVDDPTYHALFTVLFYTGHRKGEVFALTRDKIDLERKTIRFDRSVTRRTLDDAPYKVTSTKNERSMLVPICPTVVQELREYGGNDPFYFGGERPLPETTVTRVFEKYIEKAGVKRIRMHDLRHSFVSMLLHLGANFLVVADLIGDTVEQVTKTYAHMYEADKMDIINRLG